MSDFENSLEERFKRPAGWQPSYFENPRTGHKIFYASARPQNPKAVVVLLGGLSEFSEKYYETAHDMLSRDYTVWTMDWAYQGRSNRLLQSRHRRHSDGFDADLSDLHKLVSEYVRPSAALPGNRHLPIMLIAHSMGGMIGMRYLSEHPGIFNAAAFSAPMLGISMAPWQRVLLNVLHSIRILDKNYVPTMGKDWNEDRRGPNDLDIFSSDKIRSILHAGWSKAEEELQVGDFTIGWLAQSMKSIALTRTPGYLERIEIPVLIALAGKDEIVDNAANHKAAERLTRAQKLEIAEAKHEILMESDAYRTQFLTAFDKMLEENNIIPTQQPA